MNFIKSKLHELETAFNQNPNYKIILAALVITGIISLGIAIAVNYSAGPIEDKKKPGDWITIDTSKSDSTSNQNNVTNKSANTLSYASLPASYYDPTLSYPSNYNLFYKANYVQENYYVTDASQDIWKYDDFFDTPRYNSVKNYFRFLDTKDYDKALAIAPQDKTKQQLNDIYNSTKDIRVSSMVQINENTFETYLTMLVNNDSRIFKSTIRFFSNSNLIETINNSEYFETLDIVCENKASINSGSYCFLKTIDNFIIRLDYYGHATFPMLKLSQYSGDEVFLISSFGDGNYMSYKIYSYSNQTYKVKFVDIFIYSGNVPDNINFDCSRDKLKDINSYTDVNSCYYKFKDTEWFKNNLKFLEYDGRYTSNKKFNL